MKRLLKYRTILLICFGIIFTVNPASALEITLAWDVNTEPNLAGYKIYYDTDGSGEPYDGTGATEGNSPIDVGNILEFTLRGLSDDADTIYYFVATAYNNEDPVLESGYSNEVKSKCVLAVTVVGSGSVILDPPGVEGLHDAGTVTATAQPAEFWLFSEWSGNATGTNPVTTIDMDGSDKTVTATFTEKAQYTLTATTTGNGSITFDPAGGTYHDGQTVSVTATADASWAFSEWTGDISGSTNPYSIVISANATINAVFVESIPLTPPDDLEIVQ